MAELNEEFPYKIVIGGLLLTGVVIGGYWWFNRKETTAPSTLPATDANSEVKDVITETKPVVEDKAIVVNPASTENEPKHTQPIESPVRTDYDGTYNYQKRKGVWYSSKKKTPTVWASWAADSSFAKNSPDGWKKAVTALNNRYTKD